MHKNMRNAGLAPPQLPAKRDLISPAWQHWTNTGTGSLQTSRWPLKSHSYSVQTARDVLKFSLVIHFDRFSFDLART